MDYLSDLNTEQRRAVQSGDGPVIIIAGPGTGKTKTLTARITHLLASGAKPQEILALTFTKKAAEEMRSRVLGRTTPEMVVGDPEEGAPGGAQPYPASISGEGILRGRTHGVPAIMTFHALCSRLLGGKHTFVTESERLAIIKKLSKTVDYKSLSARELGLHISRAKNLADDEPALAKIVAAYDAALREQNRMDFDDLLLHTRDLLQRDPSARPTYRYILIDEFQDTNRLQYDLLHLLKSNNNLFVIGDPNQSIYAFRGASGTIFEQFRTDFPGVTEISLTINYRSASEIVSLSNNLFAGAPQLQAHTVTPGRVRAIEVLNEYSEAGWVLAQIQSAIGGADLLQASHDDARHSLHDFAVLYRGRVAAITMQKYMAESGLPYQIVGDGSPYERPDVQKLIALLRCANGEDAIVNAFSPTQVKVLLEPIKANQSPAELAQQLMTAFAIEPTPELNHFVGTLVRFAALTDVIAYFDAIADQHFYDPKAEAVTLLTIHASKGLEFPHVFLIGAEEGILPHKKADEQEERRLFYVAVTRAKQTLDITYVTKRGGQPAKPSRFITQVPDTVLPKQRDENLANDKRRAQRRHAKRAQTSLF